MRKSRLKAELAGVNGFTGRGKVVVHLDQNGAHTFTVQLSGVAGRNAQIFSNDQCVASIPIDKGRAGKHYRAKKEQASPAFTDGKQIEIRQNGDVILSGQLLRP